MINQTWSPMYDMINIFEVFLPQLLRYPNPSDPLNGEAAALLLRDPKNYDAKVKGEFSHPFISPRSSSSTPGFFPTISRLGKGAGGGGSRWLLMRVGLARLRPKVRDQDRGRRGRRRERGRR